MLALLISTYEMGRQPFGLASPTAWLRAAGWDVVCVDVTKERLEDDQLCGSDLIGFHLPMHTATRLAVPLIRKARTLNPRATICAYGLYAPLNGELLRSLGADDVLGGEFEGELVAIARRLAGTAAQPMESRAEGPRRLPRLSFLVPDRSGLPPLNRFATLRLPDGSRRLVASTEASRGCRHRCRHCPVVPVYDGQFRVIPPEVVLADIATQIAAGAEHVTFGDPDFLNGPTHAMRVVETLHREHPNITYDVTIKIEHILRHRALLPRLVQSGCLFVTSAVESLDDRVLTLLDKGHTKADFLEAVTLCQDAGLLLVPTFVAFHPWMTLESYCDLLSTLDELGLVEHVAPIQLAIRLLVPNGSRLLELEMMTAHIQDFDPSTLTYRWVHPDPRVDQLHGEVTALVGTRIAACRRDVFDAIDTLARERTNRPVVSERPARDRATVPYLNEPWYC
jgi:radical SAM superfamily enzyme YgiQ (UPF0313 family)